MLNIKCSKCEIGYCNVYHNCWTEVYLRRQKLKNNLQLLFMLIL